MMALGAAMAAGATAAMAQTPTAGVTSGADSQGAIALRGGLSMLTVDGVNVTIQNGAQGLVVVDTGPATAASQLLGQIRQLSGRPIRFLIDTNADAQVIGGNAVVAAAGQSLATTDTFDAIEVNGNTSKVSLPGQGATAVVIARQTVLTQMLSEPHCQATLSRASNSIFFSMERPSPS
jgi:hypothetical protein